MPHSAPRRAGIPALAVLALVVAMGGSEPLNSNRVWARTLPDAMAPTITQVQAATVTDTAVMLTWLTDVAADSRVEILPPPDCPAAGCVTASAILTTSHSLVLGGLTAGTTYQLAVQSTGVAGNPASVVLSVTTAAAALPSGFSEAALVAPHSFSNPTAMQFAPDGRLFVSQQGGQLRVIKAGALLPAPFMTLAVDSAGERGLLGVAFDPGFASNQYIYVNYTVPADGGTPAHNRVSRFTADGDVVVPGSEFVVMDLDNATGSEHIGGAIDFGPDGKLYVAVGDNGISSNAQSMSTRFGKMLRINPDGTIPTDNPFYLTASGPNRSIWALGLRNPFTFAQNPTGPSPRMLINDVGQETWEEVNEGIAGANYGWPATEGFTTDSAYRSPLYAYGHNLILRDGVSAADGTGVKMLWSGGSIYVLGTAGGNWWKWLGTGWSNVGTTQPGGPLTPPSGTA
ncbi:MAG: PQQ-dependent sugar dehydrogenase, partial [Acidobacteriota bacterium]